MRLRIPAWHPPVGGTGRGSHLAGTVSMGSIRATPALVLASTPTTGDASGTVTGEAATTTEALLELRGVSKSFRTRRGLRRAVAQADAVRNLTLDVRAGEIVALVGESGAGKSTVGRLAIGLERPDYGEVVSTAPS